ncbi:ZIP family metal transporter [Candidatus Microgenomates bacterium]|nr:ZIP family metal transporter [Candidatus Microgenomates bacterium]
MNNITQLFLLSTLGSVVALVGGVIFLYNKKWSQALEKHSIPFAAGVLITVALVGLLPEAVELVNEHAYTIVLLTFLATYVFEHIFFDLHHHHEESSHHHQHHKSSVPLVIIGDTIHNFIDGITIGVSFLLAPGLGLITAISTFLHEVPHEVGDFGILLKAGWHRKNIIIVNLISASVTIIGAFLVFYLNVGDSIVGTMLAVAAGIFLYLGASDFLPSIEKESSSKMQAIFPLLLGAIIMMAALLLIPHSQPSGPQEFDSFANLYSNK